MLGKQEGILFAVTSQIAKDITGDWGHVREFQREQIIERRRFRKREAAAKQGSVASSEGSFDAIIEQ